MLGDSTFFEDYGLGVVFSELPLLLHGLQLLIHLLLSLRSLFDLYHFLIQALMQPCYVVFSLIYILLIVGRKLQYLLFQFQIELIQVIQLTIFLVQAFSILIYELGHLNFYL